MKKIKEWVARYLPAEIFGVSGALLGAFLVFLFSNNLVLIVYVASLAETIAYYSYIFYCDYRRAKISDAKSGKIIIFPVIRNMFLEFGVAEVFDSLLVRPFCMYWSALILSNYYYGVVVGKLLSDVIFYIPTIIAHELIKKYV